MLATGTLEISMRIVTVMVPVAVYFLILGLLNSRRRPQILSARRDFAILLTALSPLVFLPAWALLGVSWPVMLAVPLVLVAAIAMLAPPARSWVVYMLSAREAREVVSCVLRRLNQDFSPQGDGFVIPSLGARVELSGFSLLRNVTIRLHGGDQALARSFRQALGTHLRTVETEPSAMAISLLLVSTAMLAAPLALMARNMPELVRIITGLLY
ncbi:MAG: hypothetical protein WC869_11650 [Phycisphaerae bacterium]|jgi:hypothetical protein